MKLKQRHTSVTAGNMVLYGAGTGTVKSYVYSGPEMSLKQYERYLTFT